MRIIRSSAPRNFGLTIGKSHVKQLRNFHPAPNPDDGPSARARTGMALFTLEELREVISVKVLAGNPAGWMKQPIRQISLDSRSIRRGDLFVALKGDRFDGHDFITAAFSNGAAGAIVQDNFVV